MSETTLRCALCLRDITTGGTWTPAGTMHDLCAERAAGDDDFVDEDGEKLI